MVRLAHEVNEQGSWGTKIMFERDKWKPFTLQVVPNDDSLFLAYILLEIHWHQAGDQACNIFIPFLSDGHIKIKVTY